MCYVRQEVTKADDVLASSNRHAILTAQLTSSMYGSIGVWLDRVVNHEWQSQNELQRCSILKPWTCKPTEESEGRADKPARFQSVLFSSGVV